MFTHAQIYIHIYKRESAVDDARRLLCLQLFGASLNDPKTYCLVLQNPLYIYMLLFIYIHVYVYIYLWYICQFGACSAPCITGHQRAMQKRRVG